MGRFYANVTLLGVALDDARPACPRPSFVAADGPHVVVFAETEAMGELVSGSGLSASLRCVAVSAAVHDDDLLVWEVHRAGDLVAEGAAPDPADVFDIGDPGPPPERLAADLATALDRPDAEAGLAALLARDHLFATDLHAAVVRLLGLAPAAVGWGYRYLAEDPPRDGRPPVERLAP